MAGRGRAGMLAPTSLREPVLFQHPRHGLREGGADRGGDGLLRLDGAMEVAELAFGVGVAAGGFEPALQHGRGARPSEM